MESKANIENNPKFWVSNQIGYEDWPDFGDGNNIKHNPNNKIASVYQIWGSEGYLPYVYHSVIGQILYTDVESMADIFIFADSERYEYTKWLFRNILEPDSIIKIENPIETIKYMIPLQQVLQKYEIISFIDADMFFWSPKDKKYLFYKNIERYIEENNDTVLLLRGYTNPVSEVLLARKDTLCPNISIDDYLELIINGSGMGETIFNNWFENESWEMSGVFIYRNNLFKDSLYHEYARAHAEIEQKCDETVWNSWIKSKSIETIDVSFAIPYRYSLELDDNINKYLHDNHNLYMLHPIVGETVVNPHALELLNKIKQKFKEYVKK